MSRIRKSTAFVLVLVVGAAALAMIYASAIGTGQSSCAKPPGGFLIIASNRGYNDSADHNVPSEPWPVLTAQKGSTVNIVVCNKDTQAHGFQVEHYFIDGTVTLAPGQVLLVSFVVNESGTFRIYCEIVCTVHWAMQSGQLVIA